MRYSALEVLKQGLSGNKTWKPAWRDPEPKKDYDVIIIGFLRTFHEIMGRFGAGFQL